jgi:hypothetical protein
MTKKTKRSVKGLSRPTYKPLNDVTENQDLDDKKITEMEGENTNVPVPEPETPVVEDKVEEQAAEEEVYDSDLKIDIPNYTIKPSPSNEEIRPVTRKTSSSARTRTTSVPQRSSMSSILGMFSLGNPMMKYGLLALVFVVLYFMVVKKSKKSDQGPTIIEIKEGDSGEKKSVKSSINRVSSPRIVFGDLRKNPSLMVAPPMTPAVKSN